MPCHHRCLMVSLATLALACAPAPRGGRPSRDVHAGEDREYRRDEPMSAYERGGAPEATEEAAEAEGGRDRDYGDPVVVTDDAASVSDEPKAIKNSSPIASAPPVSARPRAPAAAPRAPASTAGKPRPHKSYDDLLGGVGRAPGTPAPPPAEVREAPVAPALKAGRHDDNKEYNRFLAFLAQYRQLIPYWTDVSERLLVRAVDRAGHSLPNCPVTFKSASGQHLTQATTYADGSTQFFPASSSPDARDYVVEIECGGAKRSGQLARTGVRSHELRFDLARKVPPAVPVDVAIVLDTTGSMQGQIDRLKQTLKAIHFQLTSLSTHPDIRFAMVAYRDKGDDYVTRVTPFTGDIETYQRTLGKLVADGGGDQPEDLQTALNVALHQLEWRPEALRIGFVITDAPPHTNYGQQYNYLEAMKDALARGIKWVTVGAGGLDIRGEVIYRQIAQYTMGEYVFITQHGGDDSEGGAGEASHHVGANYRTENLDQAIVRIVRRELSYLTSEPKDFDTTIVATGGHAAPRDQVLAPAVAEALRQLADYSALKLGQHTLVAVAPVTTADKKHKPLAEYLTDQLTLSASRSESFKVVERDLGAVTQEMKLQLTNLFDETKTVPIGKLVGAEVLIVGKLVVKDGDAELFAKLLRVATGEVLSVASVRVTGGAGYGS